MHQRKQWYQRRVRGFPTRQLHTSMNTTASQRIKLKKRGGTRGVIVLIPESLSALSTIVKQTPQFNVPKDDQTVYKFFVDDEFEILDIEVLRENDTVLFEEDKEATRQLLKSREKPVLEPKQSKKARVENGTTSPTPSGSTSILPTNPPTVTAQQPPAQNTSPSTPIPTPASPPRSPAPTASTTPTPTPVTPSSNASTTTSSTPSTPTAPRGHTLIYFQMKEKMVCLKVFESTPFFKMLTVVGNQFPVKPDSFDFVLKRTGTKIKLDNTPLTLGMKSGEFVEIHQHLPSEEEMTSF
eukprot:TRINITY_DN4300_c0_g1_i5.p1 TRINITY_DN4300_c0_g1~~TRINITY_DN4300_c0_g1_i5.p1  ORF type:complete len:296 (-),score=61.23 TRINITY_DN4300_c0_g1_i5:439-1326(-)